jgi:hypothetical protein
MQRNEFPAGAISAKDKGRNRLEFAPKWPFGHRHSRRHTRQTPASPKNGGKYLRVTLGDFFAILQVRAEDIDLISVNRERSGKAFGVGCVPGVF